MAILATIAAAIKPAGNPLIDIGGAYFPAWLAAMLGGLVFAALARAILGRTFLAKALEPETVMLPALFLAGSCGLWLLLFSAG